MCIRDRSLESTSISDLDFIHSGHYEIENNKIKQKFKLQKVIHSEIKILNKSLVIKDGDLVLENFNNLSGIINSNYSSQQLAFRVNGNNLITAPKLSLSTTIELDIESILDRTAIYNASGKTEMDIDFVNEGVKILIRRSKTDQTGLGMIKAIPYFENKIYCPVISLKEWITHSKINNGKIFNISDKTVALTIQKYALLAGLDKTKYAGHSLRSGFATSTAEIGADERSIMAMTGHKTTQMVRRYIQEANLFKNNALNKIKI